MEKLGVQKNTFFLKGRYIGLIFFFTSACSVSDFGEEACVYKNAPSANVLTGQEIKKLIAGKMMSLSPCKYGKYDPHESNLSGEEFHEDGSWIGSYMFATYTLKTGFWKIEKNEIIITINAGGTYNGNPKQGGKYDKLKKPEILKRKFYNFKNRFYIQNDTFYIPHFSAVIFQKIDN
jgi:hypothetical protein